MKKHHLIFLVLLYTLFSCNFYKNEVSVENNYKKNIDSIYVFGNPACEPLIFHKIKPNTKKTKNLLNCNKSGNDGSYLFSIYYNDTIVNKSHGYFTNGVPIFKNITISINKDNTISISEN
jgi:hypothetical protein